MDNCASNATGNLNIVRHVLLRRRIQGHNRSWLFPLFALMLFFVGCASRPTNDLLNPVVGVSSNHLVTIYVASTRSWYPEINHNSSSKKRGDLSFSAYTISIPPNHQNGKIDWAKGKPNPYRDFVVVKREVFDRDTFVSRVSELSRRDPSHLAGVFVHGYNTNLPESLYRLAQLSADSNFLGAPVLFDWPSRAHLSGYLADKEAATFSRDGLVELLALLSGDRGIQRVSVLGHSMGGWLTVEALRQLRLMGRNDVISCLQVTLAAPDIDIDVFRVQMAVVGKLSPAMTVLVSSDDRALAVSRTISGSRARLGVLDVTDSRVQAAAAHSNIEIVDISRLGTAGDAAKHSRYSQLSELLYRLGSSSETQRRGLNHAGAFVLNTMGNALAQPLILASDALVAQ